MLSYFVDLIIYLFISAALEVKKANKKQCRNYFPDKLCKPVSSFNLAVVVMIQNDLLINLWKHFYCATLCWHGTTWVPLFICRSVHPFATSQCSVKTAKCRITQITQYCSPGILLFWRQRSWPNSSGVTPSEHQIQVWLVKVGSCRPISCCVSEWGIVACLTRDGIFKDNFITYLFLSVVV